MPNDRPAPQRMADSGPDWRALYPLPDLPPLDPARTALVCIDLQYFDAHPDHGMARRATEQGVDVSDYFERLGPILQRTRALQTAFRQAGSVVVHAHIESATVDGRDVAPIWRQRGYFVPAGSPGAEFLPEVAPLPGEVVFAKTSSSLFNSTDASRVLARLGVDALVFCGVMTYACVELSARDAADIGFRVIVVADACTGWSRHQHEAALRRLEGGLSGIAVRPAAEVIAELTPPTPAA